MVIEGDRVIAADLRQPAPGHVAAGGDGAAAPAPPVVADATPHRRMIEDFVRAIGQGTLPSATAREGLRSVAVVEAVYRAARERGVGLA